MITIDRLVRSRRKTIALIVERDGSLTVRTPLRVPDPLVREFVESKAAWIRRQQVRAAQAVRAAARQFRDGELFLYLGAQYPLRIVGRTRPALELVDGEFLLPASESGKAEVVFVRWYKDRAREVFTQRVDHYARQYELNVQKLRISSARTRWGSCSTKGTLSFTWRLVMAPQEIVDYVVVHELVHLEIKNHSGKFWSAVGRLMPDYQQRRAWLKNNGHLLSLGEA